LDQAMGRADVCITTALIPGKRAPILVTAAMVQKMHPGAVIVDLAAEQGGNCELTKPGERVVVHGVTIVGAVNLPSQMATHSSQMFARNLEKLVAHIVRDGALKLDSNDEIVRGLQAHSGAKEKIA